VPRRIVPDELADDVATQRPSTEDGEDFEGDDGWIGNAPTRIDGGVFPPCLRTTGDECLLRSLTRGKYAHISARGPSLPFTVPPNVERYNHDPSYVK